MFPGSRSLENVLFHELVVLIRNRASIPTLDGVIASRPVNKQVTSVTMALHNLSGIRLSSRFIISFDFQESPQVFREDHARGVVDNDVQSGFTFPGVLQPSPDMVSYCLLAGGVSKHENATRLDLVEGQVFGNFPFQISLLDTFIVGLAQQSGLDLVGLLHQQLEASAQFLEVSVVILKMEIKFNIKPQTLWHM